MAYETVNLEEMVIDATILPRRIHMAEMGEEGHLTWAWDEQNHERVVGIIQRMMDDGYVFWIVKRDPLREEELEDIEDLTNNRHVVIKDDDFRELVEAGVLYRTRDDATLTQERRTEDAREAAVNDTVAHRPLRGG